MSRRVVWAPKAAQDLAHHIDYIALDSPRNATLVSDRIFKRVMSLGDRATGRPGRVMGTYEVYVHRTSLVVCYELPDAGTLHVLRIIHEARDWPRDEWPKDLA
jgi:toxin ParE1/3/4